MQASSVSDRADCSALESRSRRGASLPSGVGVFAGSGTLELAAVAAGAVVGFSVGIAAAVGTGMEVGVRASGVGSDRATWVARSTRMVVVAGMRVLSAGGFLCVGRLHPPFYASPTSFLSVHLSAVWVSLGFTRTAFARPGTELVSETVDALNSAGFLLQRLESMDCSAKIPPCLDPVRLRFGSWCRCRNQDGYPGMTQPHQAPTFAPSVRSSSGREPFDQHTSHIVRMLLSSRK